MAETFSNGGTAVVGAGGITDSATSLPTLYRAGLPASGVFRIKIGAEILKVTTGGQSDASWTVVRGTESTGAVAHSEGDAISQPLTAGALVDALADAGGGGGVGDVVNPMTAVGDIIIGGTSGTPTRLAKGTSGLFLKAGASTLSWVIANATGTGDIDGTTSTSTGDLYLATPEPVLMRRQSGAWSRWGPIHPMNAVSGFSATNTGAAASAMVSSSGGLYMFSKADGVGEALRIGEKSLFTPDDPVTITGLFQTCFPIGATGKSSGGLVLHNGASAGTTCVTFGVQSDAGVGKVCIHWWDDYDTKNASDTNEVYPALVPDLFYLRIEDEGTGGNRIYSWSTDGVYFHDIFSEARTAFMPTPTLAGFYFNTTVSTANTSWVKLLSWTMA